MSRFVKAPLLLSFMFSAQMIWAQSSLGFQVSSGFSWVAMPKVNGSIIGVSSGYTYEISNGKNNLNFESGIFLRSRLRRCEIDAGVSLGFLSGGIKMIQEDTIPGNSSLVTGYQNYVRLGLPVELKIPTLDKINFLVGFAPFVTVYNNRTLEKLFKQLEPDAKVNSQYPVGLCGVLGIVKSHQQFDISLKYEIDMFRVNTVKYRGDTYFKKMYMQAIVLELKGLFR